MPEGTIFAPSTSLADPEGRCENHGFTRSTHTNRNYRRAADAFGTWCAERTLTSMPAMPSDVVHYFRHLEAKGLRYATIRAARAAIADAHRRAGHSDPTRDPEVEGVLLELRQGNRGESGMAKPLGFSARDAIRLSACRPRAISGLAPRREDNAAARARGLTDIAIISMMSEVGLRRSEVAALRWRDITVREDGWGVITRPGRSGRDGECLVGTACLADLEAIRPRYADPDDRVFGLSPSQIGRRVRAAAQEAGLGDGYTGQSCLIGRVHDLADNGASVQELMNVGGWESPTMPLRYKRMMKSGGDL